MDQKMGKKITLYELIGPLKNIIAEDVGQQKKA